ncbi:lantibiotic dehydratase, partial [Micromonospora sp. NPDC047074]|uniref:lantibiotic dehydratase n=1 Tax=Micromonospora sp. NPDC047074 TaxID=3154339 RepID=UPI0033DD1637
VFFSSWAVDAVARVVGGGVGLREWLAPRRVPFVRVTGGGVVVPGLPARPVDAVRLRVLELCDGRRTAAQIATAAALSQPDCVAALDDLVRRRWITWRLDIPADVRPERHLRRWLERVGDPDLRQRGLAALDVLERGRDRVRAATDADALAAALAALEADFVALTGTAAAREKSSGTAPCRTLVYADSRRSARVQLGRPVLDALAPLDGLLTSAGWLTASLADRVRRRARAVHDRLRAGTDGPVDLAAFWFACMPILHGDAVADARELQEEFQRRWADVLDVPAGARRVQRDGRDIADRLRRAFAGPGRGWTAARYLSPDVLIGATDADAVERGDFTLVLGELHVATNTLGANLFVQQHPAPADLFAQTDRDHPGPRLLPLLPKEHRARLSIRVRQCLVRPEDYQVALVDQTADPELPRTVNSADAVVEPRGDQLVVVLPDGAAFDVLDVFSHVLTTLVMDLFRILPDADHSPRVTVDRMVVARESWRFVAGELGFVDERVESRRFVRARRWRAGLELPRWVFVTVPGEPRPFFVDFDSPVYVNIFAKAVRRLVRRDGGGRLTVTEMLPTPEQVWLSDDVGNRYTSELRFVAVDQTRA